MEKEFVPYEIALQLKELEFNEPCWAWYNIPDEDVRYCYSEGRSPITNIQEEWDAKIDNRPIENIGLPTFSQAFKFFREKYELRISITDFIDDKIGIEWDYEIAIIGTDLDEKGNYKPLVDYSTDDETRKFKTYEQAELACLERLIKIVKENGK